MYAGVYRRYDCAVGDAVSEAKFTKGPWKFRRATKTLWATISGAGRIIVVFRREFKDEDAHLIAASPDMYEALEDAAMEIRNLARGTTDSYDAIMALLAKARGEQ